MRIWLITVGEPLPVDGPDERLLRTGLLARQLVARGHEVVWWTSSFDHARKKHRPSRQGSLQVEAGFRLVLLASCGYRRNVSFRRLADHYMLGRRFRRLARAEPAPDVVLSSLPTLELSREAVRFGRQRDIPVLLDVRDLWPDAILQLTPRWGRSAARLLMSHLYRSVRAACRSASGILGITEEFVAWGLRYAERDPNQHDAAFPLAYLSGTPEGEERRAAERTWERQGLGRHDDFVVCFFGSFGRQLEFETVVRAAELLRAQSRPIRFVLCGSGRYLASSRRRSRGLETISLPGWVSAAEIWTLMRRSAVGILPYRGTPDFLLSIPNKAIEYFSAGLPVVSSLDGVLKRIVTRNRCGWYYPPRTPEALASILCDIYDQPQERAVFAENARRLYEEHFVAEEVYARMAAHLERVVAGPRS